MPASQPSRRTSDTDPGKVELHARNVNFDLSTTPLHWIPGQPVASNFITVLNLLLPEGERWFVQTFNEALPMIKDEALAVDMRGFIGQEAMHAEAHDHASPVATAPNSRWTPNLRRRLPGNPAPPPIT